MHMDDDSDDLDEDIERLKIVLQDDEEGEADSDGELRTLEDGKALHWFQKTRNIVCETNTTRGQCGI